MDKVITWMLAIWVVVLTVLLWGEIIVNNQFEEHGREFHGVSLWRGKLWLCTPQGTRSETGLCEAGSEQQSYSPSRIDLDRFE